MFDSIKLDKNAQLSRIDSQCVLSTSRNELFTDRYNNKDKVDNNTGQKFFGIKTDANSKSKKFMDLAVPSFRGVRRKMEAFMEQNQAKLYTTKGEENVVNIQVSNFKNDEIQKEGVHRMDTKETFVTIGYKFMNGKITKEYSHEKLKGKFIGKYMREFRNNDKDGLVNCLRRAHDNFNVFLEKVKEKIFVIKVPEGVEISNKDLCNYYEVISKIKKSSNTDIFEEQNKEVDDLQGKPGEKKNKKKSAYGVEYEKKMMCEEIINRILLEVLGEDEDESESDTIAASIAPTMGELLNNKSPSHHTTKNNSRTNFGSMNRGSLMYLAEDENDVVASANFSQKQPVKTTVEVKGDPLSCRPGAILHVLGKDPRYRSYWQNCIVKMLKNDNLVKFDEAIGYYLCQKWSHQKERLMGLQKPKEGKKKKVNQKPLKKSDLLEPSIAVSIPSRLETPCVDLGASLTPNGSKREVNM